MDLTHTFAKVSSRVLQLGRGDEGGTRKGGTGGEDWGEGRRREDTGDISDRLSVNSTSKGRL